MMEAERPPLPPFVTVEAAVQKVRLDYRPIKELCGFRENRIAVRFAYEWHDDSGNWSRSYGNELWEFDERGLMRG
jgi:nuclear transport factor 2 (NTF2) superfamily protein